jgi:hypothetical protein
VDPDEVGEDQFSDFISAANTAVSPFDLEIRSSLPQVLESAQQEAPATPPKRVYALVNTTSDPLTQLATTYSPDEIAFLKRLLDYMFIKNNTRLCEGMAVTQMQAVQLHKAPSSERQSTSNEPTQTQTAAVQSLRMTQAETMIIHLIEEGWLQKSRKGFLSLTPRALMELRGWLVLTYNDEGFDGRPVERIKFCAACKDIITIVSTLDPKLVWNSPDLSYSRANAAKTVNARVDYMTIACATSSACSKKRNAPYAKRSGPAINSWVREPSLRTRGQAMPFHDRGSLHLLHLVPLAKFPRTRTTMKYKNRLESSLA